ncbi:FAD-binding oxidoreductase [Dactylosporangium roseum]|uniref:FAD-binding oxidoreductase n=1 Tax=Dactylosporangium roseum TaxID=47989 RepID=A0ABY5ZC02_9ACTN|nr:FAD-dependent oxidoreductase [Dactylosporangium roseum]UWZ39594.1 FAD-binding oxidoreductase [Dactylosporangium roseum]
MRIAIVGAGLAGTALAWRLRRHPSPPAVDLYGAAPAGADATAASGGLVRGFQPDPGACRLAAESLAELRGDVALREAAGYREIGSRYLLPPGAGTSHLGIVEECLPGSAALLDGPGAHPFRGLPAGATVVAERDAGYLSPAGLRAALIVRLAAAGARIRPLPVAGVGGSEPAPSLLLADGLRVEYELVVLATGAWTPGLLAAHGFGTGDMRAKQIQFTIFAGRVAGLGAFVDDISGLYGRPDGPGALLLGLPCDRWDVDVDTVAPDTALVHRVVGVAARTLGITLTAADALRTVASFDCYHPSPGLTLRPVPGAGGAVLTFSGGSGGAVKSVLAASRVAAGEVLGVPSPTV